ncbi:hypothetical protein F5B20DRAFT_85075 [Whalleya microplaca]|nr:hypothetical protein F5B20DRAFT_85075 [Whalleya microplaca]
MDIFGAVVTTTTLVLQFVGACGEFSSDAKSLKARLDWDLQRLQQIRESFVQVRDSDAIPYLTPENAALLQQTSEYLDSLVNKVHKSLRRLKRKGWLHTTINMSTWVARRSQIQDMATEIHQWTERLNLRVLCLPEEVRASMTAPSNVIDKAHVPWLLRNYHRLREFIALSTDMKLSRARAMLPDSSVEILSKVLAMGDVSSLPFEYGAQHVIFSCRKVSENISPGTAEFETLFWEMGELAAALNCLDPTTNIRLLKVEFYLYHPDSKQFLFAHIPPYRIDVMMTLEELIMYDQFPETDVPLNECLKVAYKLAEAIFFLHTAGFLHKNITSHSVVILRRFGPQVGEEGPQQMVDEAYLMGFDLIRGIEATTYNEGASHQRDQRQRNIWDFDIFQHPHRLRGVNSPRYIKTYDVYSLGVVLLEIGFWRTLPMISGQLEKKDPSLWGEELALIVPDMSRRVGERYKRMVQWCLGLSGDQIVKDNEFVQEILDPLEEMMTALS